MRTHATHVITVHVLTSKSYKALTVNTCDSCLREKKLESKRKRN